MPPPSVDTISFSSGVSNALILDLKVATNQGEKYGEFSCKEIFADATVDTLFGSSGSFCVWRNNEVLLVFLGCGANIKVGDYVTIRGDVIMTLQNQNVSSFQAIVNSPENSPTPILQLSAPTLAGRCSNISIDGSSSFRGEVHDMTFDWRIVSDKGETLSLPNIEEEKSEILTISTKELGNFFEGGREYSIIAKATNSFNETSTLIHSIFIATLNTPTVVIDPSYIIVHSTDSVLLTGSILQPYENCTGSEIYDLQKDSSFEFSWIRKSGPIFPLDVITSNSKDLFIPSNSLIPGNTYQFQLLASFAVPDVGSSNTNKRIYGSAMATVVVSPPPIIVSILGGDRSFSLGENLILEASTSIVLPNALYNWNCTRVMDGSSCFAKTKEVMGVSPISIIPSSYLQVGDYLFSVSISLPQSLAYVAISTISTRIPNIQLSAPHVVNANEKVVLRASVISLDSSSERMYRWNVEAKSSYLPTLLVIANTTTSDTLEIPANMLASGAHYFIRVSLLSSSSSWARQSLYVNDRPSGGCCQLSILSKYESAASIPISSGSAVVAFSDELTIECNHFEDKDTPLTYQFWRRDTQLEQYGKSIRIGKSYSKSVYFTLPPGLHSIWVVITDHFGASTTVSWSNISSSLSPADSNLSTDNLIELLYSGSRFSSNFNYQVIKAKGNIDYHLHLLQYLSYYSSIQENSRNMKKRFSKDQILNEFVSDSVSFPVPLSLDSISAIVSILSDFSFSSLLDSSSVFLIENFIARISPILQSHGSTFQISQGLFDVMDNLHFSPKLKWEMTYLIAHSISGDLLPEESAILQSKKARYSLLTSRGIYQPYFISKYSDASGSAFNLQMEGVEVTIPISTLGSTSKWKTSLFVSKSDFFEISSK